MNSPADSKNKETNGQMVLTNVSPTTQFASLSTSPAPSPTMGTQIGYTTPVNPPGLPNLRAETEWKRAREQRDILNHMYTQNQTINAAPVYMNATHKNLFFCLDANDK